MKSSLSSGPKLRSQLLILIISVFIPVAGILFFTGYKQYKETVRGIKDNALQLINLFSYEQLQIVAQAEQFLKILSNVPLIRDLDSTQCNSFLQAIHTENIQYSTIVATNNRGIVECCAIPLKKSINLSDRSWFRRVSKKQEFIIGNFIISRSAEKASLPFAYPILNSEGHFLGVVGVAYDLTYYDEIFKKISIPRDTVIILTDSNGKVLFQSNIEPTCIGKTINDCRGFDIPDKIHGDFDVKDADGIKRTYHFKRIFVGQPSNELCFLVGFSQQVMFAGVKNQLITNIVILSVIAIFSLLMVWLIGERLILNPVNQLIERAQKIQKGDLSFTKESTKLPKELHILSIAFEEMLTKLITREKALQKSEQLYREIIEGTENLVTEVDPQGNFIFVNEASRDIFGLSPKECIGLQAFDFIHPDDMEITRQNFIQWLEGKDSSATFENRQISRSGKVRDMLWSINFVYDDKGELTSIKSIARDITDRKNMEKILKKNEEYLASVFRAVPSGLVILKKGHFTMVNERFSEIMGYSKEELLGQKTRLLYFSDEAFESVGKKINSDIAAIGYSANEFLMRHRSGREVQVLITSAALESFEDTKMSVHSILDITDRKKDEEALKRYKSELEDMVKERTEKLMDSNAELQRMIEASDDRSKQTAILNDMAELLQACETEEETYRVAVGGCAKLFPRDSGCLGILGEDNWSVTVVGSWGHGHSCNPEFDYSECWAIRRGKAHMVLESETDPLCMHVRTEPECGTICIPMTAQGKVLGMAHMLFNSAMQEFNEPERRRIIQEKLLLLSGLVERYAPSLVNLRLRESLREQSIRDRLTGLFNRRHMEEALNRELARAKRRGSSLIVVMIDVDHFKRFNDTYGHETGDAVLRRLGEFLTSVVRIEDTPCRYGGEELMLILPETNMKDGLGKAEDVRRGIEKDVMVVHNGKRLQVTASLGVASFPLDGEDMESLIASADKALYRAKEGGRNKVVAHKSRS